MLKTGIIGYPLKYTLSPKLHTFLFNYYRIEGNYSVFKIFPNDFESFIKNLKDNGLRGVNITSPYKETVMGFIDKIDNSVSAVGNINTILIDREKLFGYNTDIYGFEKSVDFYNLNLKDKRIVVIGNGGVARSCLYVVLKKNPSSLIITGRDNKKIKKLALEFGVEDLPFNKIEKSLRNIDIIINATSVDFSEFTVEMKKDSVFYDLKYDKPSLPKNRVKFLNGYPMLIYQGIKSFSLWTGISINPEKIIKEGGLI